jgi:hypothetical protein
MEKPAKKLRKEEPRPTVQPLLQERRATTSDKDIRRQLGWGLVEFAQKGALR